MNRFKEWLIHKLGGLVATNIRRDELVRICVYDESDFSEILTEEQYVAIMRKNIKQYIVPHIISDREVRSCKTEIIGYIDIPKKYVSDEYFKRLKRGKVKMKWGKK